MPRIDRTAMAEANMQPSRRRLMRRRVMNKVGGGFSYKDAVAKVIAKHKIQGAEMLVLTRDVFRLAVRRRQLTKARARAILGEVLGTGH